MSKRAEYLLRADECRKMADRATSVDAKERWLALAARWIILIEKLDASGSAEFEERPRDKGTGEQTM